MRSPYQRFVGFVALTPLLAGACTAQTAGPECPAVPEGSAESAVAAAAAATAENSSATALPLWNAGATRDQIVEFVERVTDTEGQDFVPPAERIAVFDNDGTLWTEAPIYTQLAFAVSEVKARADEHPEWQDTQPFRGILAGKPDAIEASGKEGILRLVAETHGGMTTQEFRTRVQSWLTTTKHPRFERPYVELVYQPMVELLGYLRAHDFKTYIVSGGGVEFIRAYAEKAYGVPPEQVIGTSLQTRYESSEKSPTIQRDAELFFFNDKAGKPVAIQRQVGRRPIMAFGNSDGDFEMLEWTSTGEGPRFSAIVHHTDAEREFAYDRESHIGKLDRGLNEAVPRGWVLIDMARDWSQVFPAEP